MHVINAWKKKVLKADDQLADLRQKHIEHLNRERIRRARRTGAYPVMATPPAAAYARGSTWSAHRSSRVAAPGLPRVACARVFEAAGSGTLASLLRAGLVSMWVDVSRDTMDRLMPAP
jgi:hypothetical protein